MVGIMAIAAPMDTIITDTIIIMVTITIITVVTTDGTITVIGDIIIAMILIVDTVKCLLDKEAKTILAITEENLAQMVD
jgi:hypothetical protein